MDPATPPGPSSPAPTTTPQDIQVIESSELFGSRGELVIRHNGRDYRLRRTRLGKLILTA
jgi:hemin uptake protein HemP